MKLSTDIVEDYLIVTLKGELDHHTSEDVRKKIDSLYYDNNLSNMVLDLRGLDFMDSSGIGVLIGRYKIISKRGGELGVIHISPHLHRIFEISGLYNILKTYGGLQEALNEMGGY